MSLRVSTSEPPDALWLSVNPSFRRFEQQFLVHVHRDRPIAHWGYQQEPDEPSSIDVAITLLHDYLKNCDRPRHLIGHSTGGLVGLLYARKHPQRVKSLTLLGVGVNPAIDWKAHYYTQLEQLPCRRNRVLTQMTLSLFGQQRPHCLAGLSELLEKDLITSLSLHSLLKRLNICPNGVSMPLMVGGGQLDPIVDPVQLQGWYSWMKSGDRLWLCPNGRHFFYASHAKATAQEVLNFWHDVDTSELFLPCLPSA